MTVVETKMRVKIGVSFQRKEEFPSFIRKNNWKQFPGETKISRLTEFDGEWKIYIYIYTGILEKVRRIDVAEEGI